MGDDQDKGTVRGTAVEQKTVVACKKSGRASFELLPDVLLRVVLLFLPWEDVQVVACTLAFAFGPLLYSVGAPTTWKVC